MRLSGLPRLALSRPGFGTLSGTLRSPSMSSLNAISRVGAPPVSASNARRTKVVRSTSWKVPMCGSPLGP
jgi:hypothetical protein